LKGVIMKVLLITVGTSAITNSKIGCAPGNIDNRALMDRVSNFRALPEAKKNMDLHKNLFDELLAGHRGFWAARPEYTRAMGNRRRTSAELVSTDLMMRRGSRWQPERVALLHSASNEGRFAAMLNQRIMQELWGAVAVEIREIAGLDENLNEVDENLRTCLTDTIRLASADDVYLNFTGGYKGVIPFLTVLAFQRNWKLFYLHEESQDAIEIKLPAAAAPAGHPPAPVVRHFVVL